jgi:hypothetical protein
VSGSGEFPDEIALLRLERDAAREHVVVKDAFIAHLQAEVAALSKERESLRAQLTRLEQLRAAYRRVPGGTVLARAARRWLLR